MTTTPPEPTVMIEKADDSVSRSIVVALPKKPSCLVIVGRAEVRMYVQSGAKSSVESLGAAPIAETRSDVSHGTAMLAVVASATGANPRPAASTVAIAAARATVLVK